MFHVTVLGSGASLPTLRRQTTAVAVQREGDLFLFDCGEGTQLQWRRAGLRFGKLRAICISHLHGDHVNGLTGFLQTLSLLEREQPLAVIGPPGLQGLIDAARQHVGLRPPYSLEVIESEGGPLIEAEEYTVSCRVLDHGIVTLGFCIEEGDRPGRFDVEAARRLGVLEGPMFGRLQRGETVELDDGTVVEPSQVLGSPRPGSAVAYCVDTRPCEAAVELARGTNLFICDSTFTEELSLEARRRGHSTAGQAAEMAAKAGAGRLLLIHVSARYHDPRPLLAEASPLFSEVEVAYDLMEVRV
jgi:ribonuclease Z